MPSPRLASLPALLPIFPLTGVLLLPGGRLPLNIFEPRYLAMTDHALAGARLIGMVQPQSLAGEESEPPLYAIGCAGRIVQFAETDDGRYLLTLTGLSRFTIRRELPLLNGFRQVEADWSGFEMDLVETPPPTIDRERLGRALRAYFERQGIQVNWQAIEEAPDDRLLTTLAMVCPFEPPEKQALLETRTASERADVLLAILEVNAATPPAGAEDARH